MEDLKYQIDLLTALNERLMASEHIYRAISEFSGYCYIYKDYRDLRPYTFSIHHFNASWMSKKKQFSLFLRRILPQGLSEPLFWVWNKIRSN